VERPVRDLGEMKKTVTEQFVAHLHALPRTSQTALLRDLDTLVKHYRWRGVCSGGGRVRGTNISGFEMWRAMYQRAEKAEKPRRRIFT
jgi:hypothetical protein